MRLWATPGVATRAPPLVETCTQQLLCPFNVQNAAATKPHRPDSAGCYTSCFYLTLAPTMLHTRPPYSLLLTHAHQTLHIRPSTLHSRTRRSSAVTFTGCRVVLGTAAEACGCREALLMGNHTAPHSGLSVFCGFFQRCTFFCGSYTASTYNYSIVMLFPLFIISKWLHGRASR